MIPFRVLTAVFLAQIIQMVRSWLSQTKKKNFFLMGEIIVHCKLHLLFELSDQPDQSIKNSQHTVTRELN